MRFYASPAKRFLRAPILRGYRTIAAAPLVKHSAGLVRQIKDFEKAALKAKAGSEPDQKVVAIGP